MKFYVIDINLVTFCFYTLYYMHVIQTILGQSWQEKCKALAIDNYWLFD